jgi:hypothetical protein
MAGKHRRNLLCNHCGKAEGEPQGGDDPEELVSLLIDLEEYDDGDRVFQAPRSPDNPLPPYLVWCVGCARVTVDEGDPITNFREFGFPDNSPNGPFAQYLARHGRGFRWPRHGPERPDRPTNAGR